MNDLLKKVYEKVVYYEQEHIEAGKRIDKEAADLLEKTYGGRLAESEIEELKNLVYASNFNAQYEGFMLGVKITAKALLSLILD